MMTNGQILQLAKFCGFEEFIGEKDDETDGVKVPADLDCFYNDKLFGVCSDWVQDRWEDT